MADLHNVDPNLVGKAVYTKGTNVNLRAGASTGSAVVAKFNNDNTFIGYYIGTFNDADGVHVWCLLGKYTSGGVLGYVRTDVSQFHTNDLSDKAILSAMITDTLTNNRIVFDTITKLVATCKSLRSQGSDYAYYKATANKLLANLNARQKFILDHPEWFKVNSTINAENAAYIKANSDILDGGISGLGIIPIVVGIIWGITIIAALIIIKNIIDTFKGHASQSVADVKLSKEAEDAIAKLPAADKAVIKKEIQVVADKNLQAGVDSAGGIGKQIGYAALAIGGALVAWKLIPETGRKK